MCGIIVHQLTNLHWPCSMAGKRLSLPYKVLQPAALQVLQGKTAPLRFFPNHSRKGFPWAAEYDVHWNGWRNAFAPGSAGVRAALLTPRYIRGTGKPSCFIVVCNWQGFWGRLPPWGCQPRLRWGTPHRSSASVRAAITKCPWEQLGALQRHLGITASWGPTLACQVTGSWIAEDSY